jgi:histidinol-phosphate aminotransferase
VGGSPPVRRAVRAMAPYAPPEDLEAIGLRTGIAPQALIKLDANENPYGPSPRVAEALARFDQYHRYPDPDQKVMRPLVGAYAGVPADSVMLGNGSDEIIDLLCRIYLDPGDEVIDCTPTFGMYLFSTALCGGKQVEVPRTASWAVDVEAVLAAITPRTRLIFLATPNNPTGNAVDRDSVSALLRAAPVVVLDEAYVEFSPRPSFAPMVQDHDNLVVLRTFSKWSGLAGLRVGYGVLPPGIAQHLWKVKPPFNVNLAAEAAVRATLDDLPRMRETIAKIVEERERMAELLGAIDGLRVWPSVANFLLVDVASGRGADLKRVLQGRGIAIRAYSHTRLADAVRISVGTCSQTDAVVAAVREWRAEYGEGA